MFERENFHRIPQILHSYHCTPNTGTRLWRDFDRRYFRASGKTKPEREKLILRNKKEIAKSLNDDFQKVYFATKSSGEIVELYEMTYAEMLNRMISLMYVVFESRYFYMYTPQSYHKLTRDRTQVRPREMVGCDVSRYGTTYAPTCTRTILYYILV